MATTTELAKAQIAPPIVQLRDKLMLRAPEIKAALTDIPVDQFVRAVVTSAQLDPNILACDFSSIWLSCMRACRDGLLPDGIEGAIVPFKNKATWLPMYQGLLRRFRRSGQFRWINAGVVRKGEEFTHYIDEEGEHFLHKPGDSFDAPIERIYAIATTKDGGVFVTVMSIAEANKIRAFSKTTREDSPWKTWPEEMLKKTALRRLSKYLPSARDLVALEEDDIIDRSERLATIIEDAPSMAVTEPAPPTETEQPQTQAEQAAHVA